MRGPVPMLIESEGPDEESHSDPVQTLVLPLWRSRWLIGVTVAVGAGIGLFLGIMAPNTYRSIGRLNLRPGAREAVTSESLIDAARGSDGGQTRDYMSTELAMLKVQDVYERVARRLSPPILFSAYDPAVMDDEDTPGHIRLFHKAQAWWFNRGGSKSLEEVGHQIDDCPECVRLAAEALEKHVLIYNEPYTPIIAVSYAAHDPLLAQRVVDTVLEIAVERHQEYYNTADPLHVVTEKLENARKAKEAANESFQEYRELCGFFDLTKEKADLLGQRTTLAALIAERKATLLARREERELVAERLDAEPRRIEDSVEQEPLANAHRQYYFDKEFALLQELTGLESQSMERSERKRKEERIGKDLEQVRQLLAQMDPFIERPPRTVLVPNPDYDYYRKQLDAIDRETRELETRIPLDENELERIEERITQANRCGDRYQAAEDAALKARERFLSLEKSKELAEGMHSLKDSNLQIIETGREPREKEGPRRAKLLIVGLILGGLAGAALGFARTLLDKTVRSPADVESKLGMRVVGVLPRRPLPRSLRRAMRRAAL